MTWNPGGLGSSSKTIANQKINLIKDYLLYPNKLNVLVIVETHLKNEDDLPQQLKKFEHIYHIKQTKATISDTFAGIAVFINKKYEYLKMEVLIEGRLLYVQVKNILNIIQIFSVSTAIITR